MGLYYRPMILPSDPDGLDHYFAYSRLTLPMQLYLYDYESGENIFSWEPTEDQWWITGFNPECKKKPRLKLGVVFLIARSKVCNHSFLIMLF